MITIDYIQKEVADYFNMPVENLQLKTRKRQILQARQIAMYFSKSLTKSSLASIGSQIGKKDHATVLHACKTVNNLIDTDKFFRYDIEEIEKRIKENSNSINKEEIYDTIRTALLKLLVKHIAINKSNNQQFKLTA